jgi:hypothetical protein
MSKLSDYSKFDHLNENDDESVEEEKQAKPTTPAAASNDGSHHPTQAPTQAPSQQQQQQQQQQHQKTPQDQGAVMRKDERTGRFAFEYNGKKIYEWEQSLDDVTIYVDPPPFVTKGNQININIMPRRLQLGLHNQGNASQWFVNEATHGIVDVSESTWSLEDADGDGKNKVITIYLTKAHRGELWDAALQGNQNQATAATTSSSLDPLAKEEVRKELMLERFQEENPGFDFRDAEFNGGVPDARTFMGGVKYE